MTAPSTLRDAIRETLRSEMQRDSSVVLLGEDVGSLGGVFGVTEGLADEFGTERVIDLDAGEEASIGVAIGMAAAGLRPVVEVPFGDFLFGAFDAIVGEMARVRYRSGGVARCPLVLRTGVGGGVRGGLHHSASPEAHLVHTPGLKVVAPSSAADAADLLAAAIRDDDPVVFLEPKVLYAARDDAEPGARAAIGRARVVRAGRHVTIATYGGMVRATLEAASRLAEDGIEAEVLDLRTLAPLDEAAILDSVNKTGRLVVVNEAPSTCGIASEVAALVAERAIYALEAPVARVTGFDTPVPYGLEDDYRPGPERIATAATDVVRAG